MPAAARTSSASSASSGLSMKSRSWSDSGPPRTQAARPPPSMKGTPASRSAPAAFLSVTSMASRSAFGMRAPGTLPRRRMKRAKVRIAAAGDIHCTPERRAEIEASFASLAGEADLVLLAGDLTTYGEPEEAAILAAACRGLHVPVVAVLGNHDWHANRSSEIVSILEAAGVKVLERGWSVCDLDGTKVGIVGTKGFVGGFPDSALPDFGEPLLRQVYAETTAEVAALEEGLEAIADCPLRVVLLHYAPTATTLEGSRKGSSPSSVATASPGL